MTRRASVPLAAILALLLVAAVRPASAQERRSLPEGVTLRRVAEGRSVYLGKGLCHVCHGRRGEGVREAGSSLRDTLWYHTDGSYGSLVERTREGITAQRSATGIPMPPRGGSEIDLEEARAAAAFVWWLSRGGDPEGPGGSR